MNYLAITHEDVCNGIGLRCVIWCSGCSHACRLCQNPQTWDQKSGIPFDEDAKQAIFNKLSKDYISGLTLSGGDPLFKDNVEEIYKLVVEVKQKFPTKNIWLYSGYTWEQLFEDDDFDKQEISANQYRRAIILMCDVFVDGEYIDEQRDVTLKWCGSKNQRVIDISETIKKGEIVLWTE